MRSKNRFDNLTSCSCLHFALAGKRSRRIRSSAGCKSDHRHAEHQSGFARTGHHGSESKTQPVTNRKAATAKSSFIRTSKRSKAKKATRIVTHIGNVDVRYGIYRLQADKIIIYEAENKMVAEGSVVFDQGDDQRITGASGDWNYKTKLGNFEDSTGFTNQTNDGTVIYFTAERVERVGLNEIVVTNGKFTACEEAVPKWSFTADEARRFEPNDKVKLKNAKFRVKDIPLIPLPYASIPIEKRDRHRDF